MCTAVRRRLRIVKFLAASAAAGAMSCRETVKKCVDLSRKTEKTDRRLCNEHAGDKEYNRFGHQRAFV